MEHQLYLSIIQTISKCTRCRICDSVCAIMSWYSVRVPRMKWKTIHLDAERRTEAQATARRLTMKWDRFCPLMYLTVSRGVHRYNEKFHARRKGAPWQTFTGLLPDRTDRGLERRWRGTGLPLARVSIVRLAKSRYRRGALPLSAAFWFTAKATPDIHSTFDLPQSPPTINAIDTEPILGPPTQPDLAQYTLPCAHVGHLCYLGSFLRLARIRNWLAVPTKKIFFVNYEWYADKNIVNFNALSFSLPILLSGNYYLAEMLH